MKRREFVISTAAGFGAALLVPSGLSLAAAKDAPDLSVVTGGKIHKRVKKAVDMLGGMSRFVRKDDVVVVKPNIGWDKEPKFAANTNPWVVAAVVRLCLEAGAKKVKVFDRPCQTAARCYKSSGIEEAAKKAGAEVSHTVKSGFVKVKLPEAEVLKSWPFYKPALDADVLINVPVAKHHGYTDLSLGMKNLMGIMGGDRGTVHVKIHRKLADTARFIRPALTIIDAARILTDNGPQGGKLKDVTFRNTLIAGTDIATVDAYGVSLFDLDPADLKWLTYGHELGLGEIDLAKVTIKKAGLE